MKQNSIKFGQLAIKYLSLIVLLLTTTMSISQNHDKKKSDTDKVFDGFYLGLNVGSQNIFGGAFIDNLDVLSQKNGFVVEFSSGYRKQLLNDRLLIGAALQFGLTDGDLEQVDNRNQLKIDYENSFQFGYSFNLGVTLGKKKNVLAYAYGSVTKRRFNITITDINRTSFSQLDEQRFLRYGIGLETPIYKNFSIKATVGTVNVDYDEDTNMDVDDKFDFNLGVVYQF
ncbi:porin family protein [Muriicola sp. Z0-33]|uniref:porin family protein n=1 Tax=Muriicola sp. Z0-33 TaxID=2816957 RepID=UPI002237151D|nr:porin family protein [Muriicola sp. Z0-33]MCW5518106.1 porin family protein [Muriicola sp. Z0-33]